jgi:hypothetical protein
VFGTEKASDTVKLAKMNLAVHGLSGDIREANTYYEDPHKALGRFDFVMANPPFNVSGVDKDRLKDDPRFALGLPNTDNANYLWIQLFAASAEREWPRRLRDGQLGRRRARQRAGDPQEADPERRGGRDRQHRLQLLLHRHAALHAVVLRPGQGTRAAQGQGAVHGCAACSSPR